MLELDTKLTLDNNTINAPNLTDAFSDYDLSKLGAECLAGYIRDKQSREIWMRRNEAGMDLALQIQKDKTFPWPSAANVAFPLVTIAALQFHARAYPALLDGPRIVKVALSDPQNDMEAGRGDRIAGHMSWQLLFEDKCWEEQEDRAIFNLSIVGCNFKKSYRCAATRGNVSELVLAKNLVLDYWAKSVEDCPRKTHIIPMFRNDIYEGVKRGLYRDVLEQAWYQSTPRVRSDRARIEQDNRQGITPPAPDETSAFTILEQHCNLDLDGDGYAEPYIITFEESSATILRIVCRFNSEKDIERVASGNRKGDIIRIQATEYFTKKSFIPSPDGGIYDIGFGVFLGPLNEATNSLVNMLLDCGTLQTTAGGFLGRGVKVRGGTYSFSPFEWKRVDSTGDDLRKSIFPLPVNTPSDVLFQLLSLLINYASRVSGTTDITVGENPGQNTPAQTTQTMVEMGQKIYTAIFKRLWRSSKAEFEKLFKLNQMYLIPGKVYPGGATLEDYRGDGFEICPVADPNVTSENIQIQRAMMLKQAAATTPGYNKDLVEMKFLSALRIEDAKMLFPGGAPPPEDPRITLEKVRIQGQAQLKQGDLALRAADMQHQQQKEAIELMEERRLNNAKIIQLMAQADQFAATAQNESAYAQVAAIDAQIAAAKMDNERIRTHLDHVMRAIEIASTAANNQAKLKIEEKKLASTNGS
jgi:chaperonin GroES